MGSGFNEGLHPRDARGRFARKGAIRDAQARNRGDGPTSNTGLRNALRRNEGDSKGAIAGRIMALPRDQRAAVKGKFLNEGVTPALKGKLSRALSARMSELNRQASSGQSSRNAAQQAKEARRAKEARQAAERERQAQEAARQERARQQVNRLQTYERRTEGVNRPTSTTGHRNVMRRNPIDSSVSGSTLKGNIIQRIHQVRPGDRNALRDKFVEHGVTRTLKDRLAVAEMTHQTELGRENRASQRANRDAVMGQRVHNPQPARNNANPAQPGAPARPAKAPRTGGSPARSVKLATKVATKLRDPRIANRSSEQITGRANSAEGSLPGTDFGNRNTAGLSPRQIKTRLANRIAALPDAKRADMMRTHAAKGLSTQTFSRLRQHESAHINNLNTTHRAENERRQAAQREREREQQRQAIEAERRNNPRIAAVRDKLVNHPKFQDLSNHVNSSNLHHFEELFNRVSPEEFHRHVMAGMPRGFDVNYSIQGNTLNWQGRGGGISNMTRNMKLDEKHVYHAYFQVESGHQGGGVGKSAFKSLYQLYEKAGIKTVGVTANIDVGGYAWARYGFKPKNSTAVAQVKGWVDSFRHSQSNFNLSSTQKELLDKVSRDLANGKAEAIWDLVDHNEPLKLKSGRTSMVGNSHATVGKKILLGKMWSGVIDFTDPANKRRAYKYVGLPA